MCHNISFLYFLQIYIFCFKWPLFIYFVALTDYCECFVLTLALLGMFQRNKLAPCSQKVNMWEMVIALMGLNGQEGKQ